MSEARREALYERISAAFAAAAPLGVYLLARESWRPRWNQEAFTPVLLAGLVGALVFNLLVALASGGRLRFWVKAPLVDYEHEPKQRPSECARRVCERLAALGFEVAAEGDAAVRFRKAKSPQILSFLDHAFDGAVQLQPTGFGTRLCVRVTLHDTLLFDVGEPGPLHELARYASLETEAFAYRNVPLVLYSGTLLAWCATTLALLAGHRLDLAEAWLPAVSAASVGYTVFALHSIRRDPERLSGRRLAWATLCLALLPFASLVPRLG